MADGSPGLSEIPSKSFRIVEATQDIVADSSCAKGNESVLGAASLSLVALTTANYEEVASEIAQAGTLSTVCAVPTSGPLQSSIEIAKYEEASGGIVIGGSVQDPSNMSATLTTVAANVIAHANNLAAVCPGPITDSCNLLLKFENLRNQKIALWWMLQEIQIAFSHL